MYAIPNPQPLPLAEQHVVAKANRPLIDRRIDLSRLAAPARAVAAAEAIVPFCRRQEDHAGPASRKQAWASLGSYLPAGDALFLVH